MMLMSSAAGRIREKGSYPSTPDVCKGILVFFLEHAGSVKIRIVIINDPFVSQCTVRVIDNSHDTAGIGSSGSSNLYVKYSDLRNESQTESRK